VDDLEHLADATPERKRDQRSQALRLVVGGVLGAALLLFVVQNTQSVQLHFLTFTFETQQWVFVVVVAAITFGLVKVGGHLYRRSRAKAREARHADK
jgi:uncharacterized integral membrane protein